MCIMVDGDYLTDHPLRLFADGKAHPVKVMAGFNTNEAAMSLSFIGDRFASSEKYARRFIQNSIKALHFYGHPKVDKIGEAVTDEYVKGHAGNKKTLVSKCLSAQEDHQFGAATVQMLRFHSGQFESLSYGDLFLANFKKVYFS